MYRQVAILHWLVAVCMFVNSGCGGMDQKRAMNLSTGHTLATPPIAELNREIALRAEPIPEKPEDYKIGPEDVLEITFFGIDAQNDGFPGNVRDRVSEEGAITLPLVGEVQVQGQTPVQLEQTLRERYSKFMRDPEIGVVVSEYHSHGVTVLGAVGKPGVYQIAGSRKLRDLLALAGGISDEAGFVVHVARQEPEEVRTYVINLMELSQDTSGEINVSVRPGDVITVPKAGTFFVDGYVGKPGAYPLLRPYTISQALAVAGGIDDLAKTSEITVFRNKGSQGEVEILTCDLSKIQALEAPDIQIAENDVIMVPPNNAKIIISNILGSIGFGVRSSSLGFGFGRGGGGGLGVRR